MRHFEKNREKEALNGVAVRQGLKTLKQDLERLKGENRLLRQMPDSILDGTV